MVEEGTAAQFPCEVLGTSEFSEARACMLNYSLIFDRFGCFNPRFAQPRSEFAGVLPTLLVSPKPSFGLVHRGATGDRASTGVPKYIRTEAAAGVSSKASTFHCRGGG